jgi:hypothetical protein
MICPIPFRAFVSSAAQVLIPALRRQSKCCRPGVAGHGPASCYLIRGTSILHCLHARLDTHNERQRLYVIASPESRLLFRTWVPPSPLDANLWTAGL